MAGDATDGPGPPSPPRPPDPATTSPRAHDPGAPASLPPPPQDDETPPPTATNIAMAPSAPQGWDPEVTQRIKETMSKTWSTPLGYVLSSESKKLFAVATAVYPLHDDAHLRAMSADEASALDAYMSGNLDLPAPPTFLSCTMPALKRAAILAYHHRHIEVTLVANVGARLRVGKYLMKKAILRELLAANGGSEQGQRMMKRLMTDALRIVYDGMNTMSFVFPSKRVAQPWVGAAFKFRTGALVLASAKTNQPGVRPPPQLAQHYAVNVLGVAALDPITVMTIFNQITGDRVLDIRQRGLDGLNEADNDYWTVIFADLDCPPSLRGVTCILVEGSKLYLHHFKRTPLAPCKRCLNPNHVASRCKVLPSNLEMVRASRQRKYTGHIPSVFDFAPQDYTGLDFVVNDLDNLLRTQVNAGSVGETGQTPLAPVQVMHPSSNSDIAATVAVNSGTTPPQPKDDGFRIQRRYKKRDSTTPSTYPRGDLDISAERSVRQQAGGRTPPHPKHKTQAQPGHVDSTDETTGAHPQQNARRSKRGNVKPNPAKQFARFAQLAASERYRQTREAYALLNGEDEGEDEDCAMDEASGPGEGPVGHTTTEADFAATSEVDLMDIDQSVPPSADDGSGDQLPNDDITLAECTGSQGLDQPTPYPTMEEDTRDHCDDESSASDDETAEMLEKKRTAQILTDSYSKWLAAGNGHEVVVDNNGQSLYSAYYATTANLTCGRWRPDETDLQTINQTKQRVLNVLLANLRYDAHLELVDTTKEIARMYPNLKIPSSTAAASAKMYAHFAADRAVCASAKIDNRTRVSESELRALAVFTREPVYVWKKNEAGLLRVEQYTRHIYTMPNGDKHETGVVVKMTPEVVVTLLEECTSAHVVPIMLIYDESTGQYTGTSYAQTFTKWDTQAGPNMRQRLELVHRKLHFEVLDGSPLDYQNLALEAEEEEESILDELGLDVYASGSQKHAVPDKSSTVLYKRASVPPSTQVHEEVYSRILQEDSSQKLSAIDARMAEKLHRCNGQAFKKWVVKNGSRMGLHQHDVKYDDPDSWPLGNSKAMRLLFGHLPFPELAAQRMSIDQIVGWGEHEAYRHQRFVLVRISEDPEQADEARELIKAWLSECHTAKAVDASRIIQDEARWIELRQYVDESLIHTCTDAVPYRHWYITHVLPYVVRRWSTTTLARIPDCSRTIWYTAFSEIKKLCQDVESRRDWSGVINLALSTARVATLPTSTAGVLEDTPSGHNQ